ncbi:HNH endonuclease [Arthrobacter sp. zg-Y179]|uniref:HNH endonuclease n=1 Tax=Arthrobacter sp. zg-Y179 TaxID=2894188 RepID=UPI001E4ACBBF|nr:HNH endonuclease signature motif containing protein [Arthrobacter sp. zg-Y179]MCC9176039.1 DUF222 domain-containing protein [Arthrobacter sp. zg-Y179]
MDQLGNTEWTTEEPGSEDQQPDGSAGETDAPCAACSLSVYRADRADLAAEPVGTAEPAGPAGTAEPAGPVDASGDTSTATTPKDGDADHPVPETGSSNPGVTPNEDAEDTSTPDDAETASTEPDGAARVGPVGEAAGGFPDGFTGTLALQNLESFDESMVAETLGRVAHLISWGQALEARLVNRMGELFRDDLYAASERIEPGLAFSLAASECAAILNIPQVTGQRLLSEATGLCTSHTATLTALEEGRLSYQHAQVVLEQCQNVPAKVLPEFEADLLKAAEGQTRSQFSAKARRLREKKFPETISKRHLTAFEQRKVTLDREEDGMSCLSAYLQAAEAQQIYTTLSTAARGEQVAGDSRTTDQLRADILAQLLMGGNRGLFATGGAQRGTGHTSNDTGTATRDEDRTGFASGSEGAPDRQTGTDEGIVPRAEIMVLISAETLFGADDQPAELHGYGPISAQEARRLARNAVGWTGLAQDPQTGEILGVGRRRKVPAGLRRWLRARDGTCRFPGCRVSTANADIDHTVDWARGGPTDHGNLEHLCRRHHRFKTLGYWKANQPVSGVIEWTSPTGRVYRTEPFLELDPPDPALDRSGPSGPKDSGQEDCRQEQAPPF